MLTPKVISGKKLSQCREHVFKQKRFPFTTKLLKSCPEQHFWLLSLYHFIQMLCVSIGWFFSASECMKYPYISYFILS